VGADNPTNLIAIARIARTRGIRGEVLADLHTDFPTRFEKLAEVWLEFPDLRRQRFLLQSSWEHRGRRVLKFKGIDSISDAEQLIGAWIRIEQGSMEPLEPGTYYDHDLVGCLVQDVEGNGLGTVLHVQRIQGNSLLVVEGPEGEFYVPAVAPICTSVRIDKKLITVDLPEGLIDLNR